ncbi:MAG: nucleoside-diphosphate sugar epimerase/dehydratase [Oxalobacteraceae bacterium]|nr:nucleoside-diphosphate sugar epimerase/dehydratase [Oxalobacteraceae bacterium]
MLKPLLDVSRFQKQIIAATVDLFCLPLAFCVAVWLRYDGFNIVSLQPYTWMILAAPLISIPIFIRLGLYRAVIRFIDHKIVYVAVIGVTLSVVVLVSLAAFSTHMIGVSRGVFGIYWVSAILYVAASRFVARSYLVHASGISGGTCVAIYGAGGAGNQLASALKHTSDFRPVAFIDDKKELQGATIAGIKVYAFNALQQLIIKRDIKEVLLAMPSLNKAQQKHILERLAPLKLKIKVTPPLTALVNGKGVVHLEDVREIEIEDLLGRDQVAPDPRLIAACITGKSVMVSGAGGSIGSELCRQILRQQPARLILLEMSEFALYTIEQELRLLQKKLGSTAELMPFLGSVLEGEKCQRIMRTFAVETVYHAAAYKHVPLVEHNPIEGIRNNVFGTLSIAQAAMSVGVNNFVLISTDKAVRPTNVMGATKRLSELVLQAFARQQCAKLLHGQAHTRFCMVRFGNVLGSSGSVVPLFRKQILAGGPITLTHPEITRYFMTIPEAAQLVLQAGSMGEGGDVFVLDMGQPVKIMDLATQMVRLSGLEVKSEATPEGTIELHHVGLRPGEKLYEELLIGDNVEGTDHPLIMCAQEAEIPWPELQGLLQELANACERFDFAEIRVLLHRAVGEYAPQCGIEDFIWREQSKSSTVPVPVMLHKNRIGAL